MATPESPPDFDDELLSAYLDGQLSPAERASVDARLASDERAVGLLEELRAIQRAVRDMPSVPVGADLRASVLRQVEQSSPPRGDGDLPAVTRAAADSSAADLSVPSRSFGGSRRGWAWAGLAVAAALLIMVVTSDEKARDQPSGKVARRLESREESSGRDRVAPELRAVPRSGSGDNRAAGTLLLEDATGPTTDDAEASLDFGLDPSPPMADVPAPETRFAPPAEAAGESLTAAASSGLSSPLVVHVSMPRSAWRNRAFDELLRNNGIAIDQLSTSTAHAPARLYEAEPSGGAAGDTELGQLGPAVTASADASPAGARLGAGRSATAGADEQPANEQPIDVVLVEAPSTQVEACLTEIHDDLQNYLAVEVSEPVASAALIDRLKIPDQVDLPADASSWRQFNRGQFAPSQRVQLNRLNTRATGAEQQAAKRYRAQATEKDAFRGGYAGAGRARRLDQSQQVPEQRQLGPDASVPTTPSSSPMQVLFLLSPDPDGS